MKKLFFSIYLLAFLFSVPVYAQKYNSFSVSTSLGMLTELGEFKSDGTNLSYGFSLDKQLTPAFGISGDFFSRWFS